MGLARPPFCNGLPSPPHLPQVEFSLYYFFSMSESRTTLETGDRTWRQNPWDLKQSTSCSSSPKQAEHQGGCSRRMNVAVVSVLVIPIIVSRMDLDSGHRTGSGQVAILCIMISRHARKGMWAWSGCGDSIWLCTFFFWTP